jgi:parallel beta-helix repeat protein
MRFFPSTLPIALLLCAPALPALAATLTVLPGQSIQSAVSAANPGDTIVVKGGTYGEQVVIASNAKGVPLNGLSLVGTNGATLNGPGVEATDGITIEVNNVTVRGFTIEQYNFGILVSDLAGNALVMNTRIYANYFTNNLDTGIFFDSDVAGADCHDNTITASGAPIGGPAGNSGFGDGIDINYGTGVHVHSNLIYNNASVGINDSAQVLTDNNGQPIASTVDLINQNTIVGSGAYGIAMNGSIGQVITQNIVSGNTVAGIYVTNFTANCTFSYNLLDGNTYDGLYLDAAGATQSTFTHNTADYNGRDGIEVVYAPELGSNTGNIFTNDEASSNKNFDAEDISPIGTNTWRHDQFGKTNPPNLGK